MSRQESARAVALRCLLRIDHAGAYANLVVPAELGTSGLGERDRRFVTELVYGTTRMRRACDAVIDRFVANEPSPDVRTLLRLGAYQLQFAEVAPHAAVAETVGLAPARVRGFVNAVLRNVSRTPMVWPNDAVRLSVPDWILGHLTDELGADDAIASLEAMNRPASVTERDDGYVQDLGSQWVAAAVAASPDELVLDVCAAPGGKATAVASSGARVVASDVRGPRLGLVRQNSERLGAGLILVQSDATALPYANGCADHVLVDAPCSGLGTLRRRPDARWRISAADVDELAELQRRMLVEAARVVRPGGTLVYSVCTLLAAESVDHPVPDGFDVVGEPPPGAWRPFRHGWRVLPHDAGTDGMILVRYRRHR